MNLDSDSFDVLVLGTGLAQSIAAAALAKAGKTVLHLDPNEYYGGEQASLTLDELEAWAARQSSSSPYEASQRVTYTRASTTPLGSLESDKRRYALSLFPALMASRGDLVSTLISSNVAQYVSFKLLDGVYLAQGDGFSRVPGSKEDVFKDKTISLPEKRKLMKALLFAGGEFESDPLLEGKESEPLLSFLRSAFGLSERLAQALAYTVAFAGPDEAALPSLKRARRYLRSMGRYGPSPFLIGQYGGAGEVAQGFCRACAVFGGTYILGSEGAPTVCVSDDGVSVSIAAHPTPVTAKHLITPPGFLSLPTVTRTSAHLIAVVSAQPPVLHKTPPKSDGEDDAEAPEEDDDTAVVVFPATTAQGPVQALIMGEGTGSCPRGQWVVYLSTEVDEDTDPKAHLEPFLAKVAPSGVEFVAAYLQNTPEAVAEGSDPKPKSVPGDEAEDATGDKDEPAPTAPVIIITPYAGLHTLTEGLDHEAREGQRAFTAVCGDAGEFFPEAEEEGGEE